MRIAILGTRGIPASYSGFETAVEQISSRLVERGHEVTVYCRPHVVDRRIKEWKGARPGHLPTLRNKYPEAIGVVPYGAEAPEQTTTKTLRRLGLEPRGYVLFVGRLEPENNAHLLVEAWARIPSERTNGMKLVVVGGAPYASDYVRLVQRTADPRVLFPGYVFGPGYWELQKNAYLLCVPTEVGGTHPILLEGLAARHCILVNDYRPNAETVGDAGVYFSGTEGGPELARNLELLLRDPELVEEYQARARKR